MLQWATANGERPEAINEVGPRASAISEVPHAACLLVTIERATSRSHKIERNNHGQNSMNLNYSSRMSSNESPGEVERRRNYPCREGISSTSAQSSSSTSSVVEAILSSRHDGAIAVDLVGIVMDVSVNLAQSSATLLISDPSLENISNCARVRLKGHRNSVSLLEQNVARGDVVRINRLVLHKENYHSAQQKKRQRKDFQQDENSNQWKVVCEFRHCWKHPQASDALWMRLCCIRNGHAIIQEDRSMPHNFATSTKKMQSLVDWFTRQESRSSLLIQSQSVKLRSLSEVATASDRLSIVVVRVLSCSAVGQGKNSRKESSVIAMLTDGSECQDSDIVALHDCKSGWGIQLKRAVAEQHWVRLTDMQSVTRNAEIVLVPTANSLITPLQARDDEERSHPILSATVHTQEPLSMLLQNEQDLISIHSAVEDICITDLEVSLVGNHHIWSTPSKLFTLLIDEKGNGGKIARYRKAVITLKDPSGLFAADAREEIMEILCGSISASKLAAQTDASVGQSVYDLVRGLIVDKVALRWTLQKSAEAARDSSAYSAVAVTLPELI